MVWPEVVQVMIFAERAAALRKLARDGKTRTEAAQELGLSYWTVCLTANRAKVTFTHGLERQGRRKTTPIGLMVKAGIADRLTAQERLDVRVLVRKGGYSAAEALQAIGRWDLAAVVEGMK